MNYLKLKNEKKIDQSGREVIFTNEKIIVDDIDYYYSNVIARASFTMSECRNKKLKLKQTGTEG